MSLLLALLHPDQTVSPPGIPSSESDSLAKVFHIVSAPGIASSEAQGQTLVAALIEAPGIPSSETAAPAEIAIVLKPPGIPSTEVEAPAEVAPPSPPPVPAKGGPAGWWRHQLWKEQWNRWAQTNGWTVNDRGMLAEGGSGDGSPPIPPHDDYVAAFPADDGDDNVYVLPLRSFESMPEPNARELEHMTLASLQRAAGYDIEGSRERVVPAYLWAARGGLIALAGVAVVAHAKMKKKQRR